MKYYLIIYHAVASCCHALTFNTVSYGLFLCGYGVSMSNLVPGFQAEFCMDMRVPLLDLG